MLRPSILLFLSSLSLACVLAACRSAGPAPASTPSSITTCPLVDAGPPPVCPSGCAWYGTECRQQGPIVVPY